MHCIICYVLSSFLHFRLCPVTAGCGPPSVPSIFVYQMLSCSRWCPPSLLCCLAIFCFSSLSLFVMLCKSWSIFYSCYMWPVLTKWTVSCIKLFRALAWKQWWGVNLGEIEIFALYRSSFIFTPYTCSFLLHSTYKCFKLCKWSTYWSIRHCEMTSKWPIFTEVLLFVAHAGPHVSHTKTKVMISRCELLSQLSKIIQ